MAQNLSAFTFSKWSATELRAPTPALEQDVLALQRDWIAGATSDIQKGFLISAFAPGELEKLIENGAFLYAARSHTAALAAYILIAPLTEFTELYKDPALGKMLWHGSPITIDEPFKYLYQMATRRGEEHRGLGAQLLQYASEDLQCPLLTDVLCAPLNNEASRNFFVKQGFREAGRLHLKAYRDFGALESVVLVRD